MSCTTAGACTYTAGAAATGQDSFNFQADDGHGGKTIGSVLITITHVNHAPVTTNGTFGTDNATGRVVDLSLLTTDQDNDPLTYFQGVGTDAVTPGQSSAATRRAPTRLPRASPAP